MNTNEAVKAQRALDYYDGDQERHLISVLNDPNSGRRNWRVRGIIPRYRNITKMVVDKSGLLFKDNVPALVVYDENSDVPNEEKTKAVNDELYRTEWQEVLINLDVVVRLLKTAMLLVQYDSEQQELVFTILHRGNSAVVGDYNTRKINGLIYTTGDYQYRIITNEEIVDIEYRPNVKETIITNREPNTLGTIPVSLFYDTQLPRYGFWNYVDYSIVSLNELVNLHLTDSEYAISWAKLPTLFTNCRLQSDDSGYEQVNVIPDETHSFTPRELLTGGNYSSGGNGVIGGPGRAVQLDSAGVDAPFIKYEGPKIDIKPINEVVDQWIVSVCSDWSVRIDTGGAGRASSGFQLIVEELPNIELRQVRQRMFERGFKRLYKTIGKVLNVVRGENIFDPTSEVEVEFTLPKLPVNTFDQEKEWTEKINNGRASVVDYLMDVQQLTKQQAEKKYLEIISYNSISSINTQQENEDEQNDGSQPN